MSVHLIAKILGKNPKNGLFKTLTLAALLAAGGLSDTTI